MRKLILLAPALIAMLPTAALAQATNTSTKNVGVVGTAPAMCFGGTLTGDGNYDLGILIDTATGQLRSDLAAPAKVLVGSFCTGRSTITVQATPLAAQNSTVAPPTGFSRQVDYVATASGWTTIPAAYNTATATNSAATQTRASAFTGDITVAISGFATSGGESLRLVADDNYRGLVTVTIAAVN
jgi:hypothetical protein